MATDDDLTAEDPLGVDNFHTHRVPLGEAPEMYELFQETKDGTMKVVLDPGTA